MSSNWQCAMLVVLLRDGSRGIREGAAWSLRGIGKAAAPAVPALTEGLRDEFARVREGCASALGRMGELAACALPDLTGLLADEDGAVQEAARNALATIKAAQSEPAR
jgi:HEAT repeat protein